MTVEDLKPEMYDDCLTGLGSGDDVAAIRCTRSISEPVESLPLTCASGSFSVGSFGMESRPVKEQPDKTNITTTAATLTTNLRAKHRFISIN